VTSAARATHQHDTSAATVFLPLPSLDPSGRRRDGLRPAIEVVSSVVTSQQPLCAQISRRLAVNLKLPCRARVAPLPEAISLRILVLQARTGRTDDHGMPPLPRRRLIVPPLMRANLATERDRRDTHRALENGLRDLRRGARWRRGRALEVQPLVQIVRPANYGVFKGRWQRAWRDTEYSTARLAEEAAR
jgi:hypothetical protein